jgi:hypothetical protein
MKKVLSVVAVAVVVALGGAQARADFEQEKLTANSWQTSAGTGAAVKVLRISFDKNGGFSMTESDVNGRNTGSVVGRYELKGSELKLYVNGSLALTTTIEFKGDTLISRGNGRSETWSRV